MEKKKIKIVVVSSQNIENVCGFKHFTEMLEQEGSFETASIIYSSKKQRDIIGEIKSLHPELLITVDLPGFEQCTLADNVSYNLLDCKQLHLLFHKNLPNEQCLNKQLSIAMFFYCAGKPYYEYLHKLYPDIPYLKELPGWQFEMNERTSGRNAEIIYTVFQEVLHECRMLM